MRIPVPTFVYGGWLIVGAVLIVSVIAALIFGLRGKGTLVQWRLVKLFSAMAGAFGVFFLMLNFETLVRANFVGDPTPAQILTYVHTKFLVAKRLATDCGTKPINAAQERVCSDLSTIMDLISYIPVRDGKEIDKIDTPNRAPELSKFLSALNLSIDQTNMYAPNKEDLYKTLPRDSRVMLTLLAGFLLSLAVAGSVGEAAFQLHTAQKR
jgi:hypothetical protein